MSVLVLPERMALIFQAAGHDVHCTNGELLVGSNYGEQEFREQMAAEMREEQKNFARRILKDAHRDFTADNIAAACGLSVHTVRGMSKGRAQTKGQRTDTYTREEIMESVEW